MKWVNLSSHDFNIDDLVIPPSGLVARKIRVPVGKTNIEGIRVDQLITRIVCVDDWGKGSDFPSPIPGTIYLVSSMIADRLHRSDVLSPDTGPGCERVNMKELVQQLLQPFRTILQILDQANKCDPDSSFGLNGADLPNPQQMMRDLDQIVSLVPMNGEIKSIHGLQEYLQGDE